MAKVAKNPTGKVAPIRKGEWQVDHVSTGKHGRGDTWRVAFDGKVKTITTSKASTRAMGEAVAKYGRALKRLADR